MPKAPEIKQGQVVDIDGQQLIVRSIQVSSPTARGASTLYKMTLNELKTAEKRS